MKSIKNMFIVLFIITIMLNLFSTKSFAVNTLIKEGTIEEMIDTMTKGEIYANSGGESATKTSEMKNKVKDKIKIELNKDEYKKAGIEINDANVEAIYNKSLNNANKIKVQVVLNYDTTHGPKMLGITFNVTIGSQLTPDSAKSMIEQKQKEQKNEAVGLPDLNSGYKPTVTMPSGGRTMNMVETILGALTIIGIIAIIISIALIGYYTILGSASEKALGQEKFVGIFIGAVLITCCTIIARTIVSLASSL